MAIKKTTEKIKDFFYKITGEEKKLADINNQKTQQEKICSDN